MRTTWKQLHRSVQIAIAAPYLCLAAILLCASTPGFRQLLLDSSNHPTTPVDFGSTNFTGTLAAARIPLTLNATSIGATTAGTGKFTTLTASGVLTVNGYFASDGGLVYSNGSGSFSARGATFYSGGIYSYGPCNLQSSLTVAGNATISAGLSVNGSTFLDGADIYTDGYGDINIGGSFTSDSYTVYSDGAGDLVADSISVNGGVGYWGSFGPPFQPSTPTTLGQVITVLQQYGLCQ